MIIVFDPAQRAHAPARELHNGSFVPHADTVARADNMLAALGDWTLAVDHGIGPIARVHGADYLAFLQTAFEDWQGAGRPGDAVPYVFPVVGRRPLNLDRIDARLGRFAIDCGTPIAAGTWQAVYAGAQVALTALDHVGQGAAFALCRPPGHHAGADYCGGYCYLNNAAIAAQAAVDAGKRVAILDIDYHHGNGTQDIFWERANPLFVSIHADPRTDYPFYWGHADETGAGEGAGATLNLPLPHGTGLAAYRPALVQALDRIRAFAPDLLVVSFGADTFVDDPISHFALRTADYPVIAADIAALGVPVLIVMEGGYAVDALGENVAAFLSGFD
ncbi:histone deacetylase family protein [Glacieibacterium frigidum]|uniref:Histone deacetylase family protein n=1 Tax=Glacieibacterium frigidum TaxID=2593303 RepID=A0A552UHM2_9SPHN|nr:histone deacetylase family protein [Glacieibacterium frigidum]TRW17687.1 histone deacetylase family protein [Glacieibacterium frigidum]